MKGRQPEEKSDLHDDDIIELKDVVQSGPEDDIIDLTEVLEQPGQATSPSEQPAETMGGDNGAVAPDGLDEAAAETDDDIIDLTDLAAEPDAPVVDAPAADAAAVDEGEVDEEVIDLTDVAKTLESDIADTHPSVPGAPPSTARTEEEVIDLTDLTAPDPSTAVQPEAGDDATEEAVIDLVDPAVDGPAGHALEAPADAIDEADDDMIDLSEPVVPAVADAGDAGETDETLSDLESRADAMLQDTSYRFDYDPAIEAAETAGPDADFTLLDTQSIAATAVSPETPGDGDEPVPDSASPAAEEGLKLTEEQLETALTAAIEKIYGDRIEQLLLETIEKTVRREIAKIKNALLEEDDGMLG